MEEPGQSENTPVNEETSAGKDESSTDAGAKKLLPLPDIGDLYFVLILNLTLFTRPTYLFGDGSTGWHLATGEYVLKMMSVPRQDLMSYTFPDKAWVAYEWLYDAILALLEKAGGMNLLAVATSIVIGYIFLRLYDRCRYFGCPLAISCLFTLIGVLASAMHWLVRPHIVTLLGVFLYSALLEDYYQNRIGARKFILYLALFMVLWVNCHPAFLLGVAMIGLYMVVCACEWMFGRDANKRQSAKSKATWLAAAVVAVLVASLLNPYGVQLYEYIAHYLKGSAVLAETDEFLSPSFKNNIHAICLELLFSLLVIGLAITKNKVSAPQLSMAIVFAHLSLSAQRNIPLFSIIVLPLLGKLYGKPAENTSTVVAPEYTSGIAGEQSDASGVQSEAPQGILARYKRAWADFEAQEARCKMHILAIGFALAMIVLSVFGGSIGGKQVLKCDFDPTTKPTKTLEYLKEHDLLKARGCNFDNWGGYIRYKLGIRVFIDDRADFYGVPFYFQYKTITHTLPGWKDILNKYGIEWLLFPLNSRVAATLKDDPDWVLASEDAAGKLFVRKVPLNAPPAAPSKTPSGN